MTKEMQTLALVPQGSLEAYIRAANTYPMLTAEEEEPPSAVHLGGLGDACGLACALHRALDGLGVQMVAPDGGGASDVNGHDLQPSPRMT